MNQRNQILRYLLSDLLTSLLGWTLYYIAAINSRHLVSGTTIEKIISEPLFLKGLVIIPVFWLFLYFLWGFYYDIYRRSRLKELGASLAVTLTGTLAIFMLLISLDILTSDYRPFFNSFINLFYIHFTVSYVPRLVITSLTINKIRKGKIGFNTIILGSDKKATGIYKEITGQVRSTGNKFAGFININGGASYPLSRYLNHLGGLDQLNRIIDEYNIEEVIIAVESTEYDRISGIIDRLDYRGLVIRVIPGNYDILTGRVRVDTIIETPLIQISHKLMPVWQNNLKRILDLLLSIMTLTVTSPLSAVIAIWIKLSSKGPVIYSHERIGKNGKPFMIYKFRTMIENAEENGPELSSVNDRRITGPGRFLRRMRLDEIPNFINVLKGDMSLVGPRPEREYFIAKIVKKAPHYNMLLKIKPGITSWGQVKYGYAENIEQMIQRLKYDMLYLDNCSLFVDFQILILTILTIIRRKGV